METSSNIDYAGKHLRFLIQRENRFPNISQEDLLNNPRAMAIAATEWNLGPRNRPQAIAKPNLFGLDVIAGLGRGSPLYQMFGRELKKWQDTKINQYLSINSKLIGEAIQDSRIEYDKRIGRTLGIGISSLTLLGGLSLLAYKLIEQARYRYNPR